MKLRAVFGGSRAASWVSSAVTFSIVESMINVAIEMIRAVIPRSSANEETAAAEPLGPIITVRSAIVRRSLVIPVGATRRFSDADCNLCIRFVSRSE